MSLPCTELIIFLRHLDKLNLQLCLNTYVFVEEVSLIIQFWICYESSRKKEEENFPANKICRVRRATGKSKPPPPPPCDESHKKNQLFIHSTESREKCLEKGTKLKIIFPAAIVRAWNKNWDGTKRNESRVNVEKFISHKNLCSNWKTLLLLACSSLSSARLSTPISIPPLLLVCCRHRCCWPETCWDPISLFVNEIIYIRKPKHSE